MSRFSQGIAASHRRARQFTEIAFALAALAALAVALIVHHTALGVPFTQEARDVVTWCFVGLATLDALLLITWGTLIRRITAD